MSLPIRVVDVDILVRKAGELIGAADTIDATGRPVSFETVASSLRNIAKDYEEAAGYIRFLERQLGFTQ